jgi:hypothetical protein
MTTEWTRKHPWAQQNALGAIHVIRTHVVFALLGKSLCDGCQFELSDDRLAIVRAFGRGFTKNSAVKPPTTRPAE